MTNNRPRHEELRNEWWQYYDKDKNDKSGRQNKSRHIYDNNKKCIENRMTIAQDNIL